jgi:metal-responsive CopG/Arc/MetJ family transcriptional regulator
MRSPHKERVTISIAADLLLEVDREAERHHTSRSAVIEARLQDAERRRKREELDRKVEEYYRALEPETAAEDDAWVRAVATASGETLRREESPRRRRRRS